MIIEKKPRLVITFTDISEVVENSKLNEQLRDMHLVSRSIRHEVTTPMRCLAEIADDAITTSNESASTFATISSTAKMCMSFIEGKMD